MLVFPLVQDEFKLFIHQVNMIYMWKKLSRIAKATGNPTAQKRWFGLTSKQKYQTIYVVCITL